MGEAFNGPKKAMAPASRTVPIIYKRPKYIKIRNSSKVTPHNVIVKKRKYIILDPPPKPSPASPLN